jgi:hypothetical protein
MASGPAVRPRRHRLAFDADVEAMLLTLDRRDRLDKAITELATNGDYAAVVRRLGCLRGVSTLTAFGLAVEIGDWHRFTGPRLAPTSAWYPRSRRPASSVARARSPKPGTPMPVGCSSPPPGTTAANRARC